MEKALRKQSRILIVDDHPLVREGLRARIAGQADLQVCGEAEDINQALAEFEHSRPDLVLVDISLKHGSGLDLIKRLCERNDKTKILVISAHDESLFAQRALSAGALGYINKQEAQELILDAIRKVLAGERYLSPEMTNRMIAKAVGAKNGANGSDVAKLSDRELQVFQLIGKGLSTRDIAGQLHLSVHTIESHREKLKIKLQIKNGSELTHRAVQWVLENG